VKKEQDQSPTNQRWQQQAYPDGGLPAAEHNQEDTCRQKRDGPGNEATQRTKIKQFQQGEPEKDSRQRKPQQQTGGPVEPVATRHGKSPNPFGDAS
jgi:hypothetical protein